MTEHRARDPQDPGQGSLHFCLMQARLLGHSEFTTHSGLQFGGLPENPVKHEQEGASPISWQIEFGPQGDGTQGFGFATGCTGAGAKIFIKII